MSALRRTPGSHEPSLAREAPIAVFDPPRTELEWANAHLSALYALDSNDRLIGRASPGAGPPPRFHLVRTRLGTVWRFAADLPGAAVRELARYAALEPGCPLDATKPPPPPDRLEPMRRVLESTTALELVAGGPAYRLPDADDREPLESFARGSEVAVREDDARLARWAGDLGESIDELRRALPLAVSLHGGRVVSVCRVARGDPRGFVEAGLETVESARGRGHGPRCVAAWAQAVEEMGGCPLYSTAWSNRASRRVAAKLGLVIYGEDWHFR